MTTPPSGPRITVGGVVGFVGVLGGLVVVAGLSLADRVPLLFERARGRVEILRLVSVPGDAFTFGHFVAWAGLAMLAAIATRRTSARLIAATVLAATSLALEAAQMFFTATRAVELRDAEANLLGVAAGTIAGVLLSEGIRLATRRGLST